MKAITPFLDLLISIYVGYVGSKAASNKILGMVSYAGILYTLPGAITAAPDVLAAFEALTDEDRKALDAYIVGKLPGVSDQIVAKIQDGLDIVLRAGGTIQDFVHLFKSGTASVVAAAQDAVSKVTDAVQPTVQAVEADVAQVADSVVAAGTDVPAQA